MERPGKFRIISHEKMRGMKPWHISGRCKAKTKNSMWREKEREERARERNYVSRGVHDVDYRVEEEGNVLIYL